LSSLFRPLSFRSFRSIVFTSQVLENLSVAKNYSKAFPESIQACLVLYLCCCCRHYCCRHSSIVPNVSGVPAVDRVVVVACICTVVKIPVSPRFFQPCCCWHHLICPAISDAALGSAVLFDVYFESLLWLKSLLMPPLQLLLTSLLLLVSPTFLASPLFQHFCSCWRTCTNGVSTDSGDPFVGVP
jgi:hypothetical protein